MLLGLLLLAALDGAEPKGDLKVAAQAPWRYATVAKKAPQQLVLRSAAELVAATPFSNLDAPAPVVERQATAELAKALKVARIDWDKQMLVVVTGGTQPSTGYRVEVTGLSVKDRVLTVAWQLHAPKGGAGDALTHPGTVALVPKFAGTVRFDPPAKK